MKRALAATAVLTVVLVGAPLAVTLTSGMGLAASQTCQSPGGPQPYAMTALTVGTRQRASERVLTAALEAGLVESNFRNLANDGIRGPEDNAATDQDLAVAAESLALPHDGVGSDNDSVGVLQQRRSWGTVPERMDPEHAFGEFYRRAITLDQSGYSGTAGDLAQAVQGSAFPDRYELALPDANRLLASLGVAMPVGCQPGAASGKVAPVPPGYGTPGPCGLSPSTDYARQLVTQIFGVRDIGGCAYSGHVENSDHYPDPAGQAHALDVMVYADRGLGDRVAAWAVANAGPLNLKYVIWFRQIWTPGRGWHPYPCPDGNPTLCHEDHNHLSFLEGT